MMHKAWSSIEEVPYCFSRSSVKFQGHTALKIVEFDPKWAFPDCNSSLNSPMAKKCCTKLETVKERCPIVFQGHPSNFKVTRYKNSPILTQIGRFRTIGQSQLSNPSDLPCSLKNEFRVIKKPHLRYVALIDSVWGYRLTGVGVPSWWDHDDVIKWKHFPLYWPIVRGIHRSRWIPRTNASKAELQCFLWPVSE